MQPENLTIQSMGSAELPQPEFNLENYLGEAETPAFEIAPGMTAEEMRAMFFAKDALLEAPEKVYRLNASGHRYYYTFDEEGQPQFFVSVTTFIKQTMPTSPILLKWIADNGYEDSQAYASERASYGTFMHALISDLLIKGSIDLNSIKSRLKIYIETEQLPSTFINYAEDLKKDILAFAQFAIDVNLKPIAIELVLTHPRDGYAGAMDLACEMDADVAGFYGEVYKTGAKAGQERKTTVRERVRAIVDFKSGKKGFFEENEVQLHAYKTMWNIHFPSTPIERVYNWSPKDWRGTTPSYNLKDQTDSPNAKKLPYLVELAKIEDDKRDNTVVLCSGEINLQTTKDLSGNISEFTLSEVVKKRTERKEPKPDASKAVVFEAATVPVEKEPDSMRLIAAEGNNLHFSGTLNKSKDSISICSESVHADYHTSPSDYVVFETTKFDTSGLFTREKAPETAREESASNDLKSNNNEIDF